MDKITANNAIALLKECVMNGEEGPLTLYSWFCGERNLINRVIEEEAIEGHVEK